MAFKNDYTPGDALAVTPSDSSAVDFYGLYVGTGGDLAVKGQGGQAVTFKNVPAGAVIPLRVLCVMSTNTTASNIVGFTR
jgi:hypothetical protein